MLDSDSPGPEPQPENEMAENSRGDREGRKERDTFLSRKLHGRFLVPTAWRNLFESEHVVRERLAIGKLVGPVGSFRIEIIEQAGGAFAVGIFADVAGLLGLVDVAALIELNDLIVGAEIFVGLDDVGGNLLRGLAGLLLRLRNGVAGSRDFALIPVEDGKRHVVEERAGVRAGSVRVIESAGDVHLSVGLLQRQLAFRGGHGLLRGAQVGPVDRRQRFQAAHVRVHGLVIEGALNVVVIGNGFESEQLAKSRQGLQLGQFCSRNVGLELQKLELDFQEIAFAHVADAKAFVADVHGFLEAVQIQLRKFQRGFRQQARRRIADRR